MSAVPDKGAHDEALLADLFDDLLQQVLEGRTPDVDHCLPDRPDLRDRVNATWTLACSVAGRRQPGRPVLGGYEILRELGHGGMGTVYLARHQILQREVAIKVLPHSLALSPRSKQRFLEEAMALARIRHDHVVRIHRIIDQAEMLAFEMEYVDGGNLLRLVRELRAQGGAPTIETLAARLGVSPRALGTRNPVEWFVRTCAKVARALDEVHRHGLVHRDVKPSNILLRADGSPVLADFGLAQIADLEASRTGAFAGTPTYAAPERLRGGDLDIDARTDVYSLGVTLYELLTLEPPYAGSSTIDVLRHIEAGGLPSLRHKAPHVSRDLATIVHKAMEPDPRDRYATAGRFADDLDRLLNLEPIEARPVGLLRRCGKFLRRQQRVVTSAAIGALLVVAVAWPVVAHAQAREASRREAGELLQAARSALLSPETLYVAWTRSFAAGGAQPLQHPTTRAEHVNALARVAALYDRVLAIDPERADARREGDAVRAALAVQRARPGDGPAAAGSESLPQPFAAVVRAQGEAPRARTTAAAIAAVPMVDRFGVGLFAFLIGDPVSCHAAWQGIEESLPEEPLVAACLALQLGNEGHPERAYPRLFHATRSFPDATVLALAMADAALVMGDPALAGHWLERVPEAATDHITPARRRLLAADLSLVKGRADEAAAVYRDLAQADVSDPVPLQRLAAVSLSLGDTQQARRILGVVLSRWPHEALARRQLAELDLQQHNLAGYLAHARYALAQDLELLPRATANHLADILAFGGIEPVPVGGATFERPRGDVRSIGPLLSHWLAPARRQGISDALHALATYDRMWEVANRLDARPVGAALRAVWFTALSLPQATLALPAPWQVALVAAPPVLLRVASDLATQAAMPFQRILGDRAVIVQPEAIVPFHLEPPELLFASAMLRANDLDGDTLPDLCIACAGSSARPDLGRVEVRPLDDGALLRVLEGRASHCFAAAIDVMADLDGDRCDDLLIGSVSAPGTSGGGGVEARSGSTGLLLWSIDGQEPRFGEALAAIGDVNGDRVGDFVVGAPADGGGRAVVCSGATGEALRDLRPEVPRAAFGVFVAAVGDVDADGTGDVLVSAHDPSLGGQVTLFAGSTGTRLATFAEERATDFGYRAVGLGDLTGDGRAEFAIGAPAFSDRQHQPGKVSIIDGATGRLLHVLAGERVGDMFGLALCSLPHWRADGRAALAVSACRGGPGGAGYVRVFDAKSGAPLQTLAAHPAVRLYGASLVDLGDRDGDGLRDLGVPVIYGDGRCTVWSMSFALVPRR